MIVYPEKIRQPQEDQELGFVGAIISAVVGVGSLVATSLIGKKNQDIVLAETDRQRKEQEQQAVLAVVTSREKSRQTAMLLGTGAVAVTIGSLVYMDRKKNTKKRARK